jgi:hypothetical protein
LTAVIGLDAGAGEFERVECFAAAGLHRRRNLLRRNLQSGAAEIEPVEFERIVVER